MNLLYSKFLAVFIKVWCGMKQERHFGLRIEDALLKKFHYVCDYEGRSANGQILFMIRQSVAAFEKEHGVIALDEKESE